MSDEGSFVNLVEIDVWCSCGREYTVLNADKETWIETCPNCGERIEFTFKFYTLGKSDEKGH